jgi:hypothetical protein
METSKRRFSCHSCGSGIEWHGGETPCEALKGAVEHYNFCSSGCLKCWVDAQLPEVPEVFLESFKEEG